MLSCVNSQPVIDLNNINETNFSETAIDLFRWQVENVTVYREFVKSLHIDVSGIRQIESIPFLPIQFFKSRMVIADSMQPEMIFTSSGTTGSVSTHAVADLNLYRTSFLSSFKHFYGNPSEYCIIALLPSYLEREGSSLIYMMKELISISNSPDSGFFLNQFDIIKKIVTNNELKGIKTLLTGVSFALLDLAENRSLPALQHTIIMETGGMKGRRKEMLRDELHHILKTAFGVNQIHSEYGMTELLSQAYSLRDGIFCAPPWMRVLVRDVYDPRDVSVSLKQGAINIIDLANQYSCAFIATDDLGRVYDDRSFSINGRADNSDVRGCNLMVY